MYVQYRLTLKTNRATLCGAALNDSIFIQGLFENHLEERETHV